jgi:hypothetical protein
MNNNFFSYDYVGNFGFNAAPIKIEGSPRGNDKVSSDHENNYI